MKEDFINRTKECIREKRLPYRLKHKLGFLGTLPDFLIIGSQKAGTTSLYNYLIQHPDIFKPDMREIHYFSINHKRSLHWYKSKFPLKYVKNYFKKIKGRNFLTGESSPSYLLNPYSAKRVFDIMPKTKIIALLRDPVERAFSQYSMMKRGRWENLSFEEAISNEEKRINKDLKELLKNESAELRLDSPFYKWSYLKRGEYLDQLKNWFNIFPKEQIMVVSSEQFYKNTEKVFNQVISFLCLPSYDLKRYNIFGVNKEEKINPDTKKKLKEYFRPHNRELYKFLGKDFGW